jgi:hypothetical protein
MMSKEGSPRVLTNPVSFSANLLILIADVSHLRRDATAFQSLQVSLAPRRVRPRRDGLQVFVEPATSFYQSASAVESDASGCYLKSFI